MKLEFFVLPAAAVAVASLLLMPRESQGFKLLGGSLSQAQRDVRIFNNFTDNTANNNTTPDPSFPGYDGAELAIWKAAVEWASAPHSGSGAGDPTQNVLGDGGANFDPSWQGNNNQVGNSNSNTHSELNGSSGGVLAFMESGFGGISDGWRIRYYSTWTWEDGPGQIGTGVDLQGVATHEFGHALGLDHTTVPGSTMLASIIGNGVPTRSIEDDDIAGVQAVYGVVDTSVKPRITSVNLESGTLTILGNNFNATNNEVWFNSNGTGTPIKATGLAATSNSIITTTIPAGAVAGDILVKKGGNGGFSGLSNPWGFDPNQPPNPAATEANIDLGTTMGTPGTGQGGAANNVGAWNSVSLPTAATGLFDLQQIATAGVLGHSGTNGEIVFDEPASSGFWEKIFDDGHDVGCSPGNSVTYSFDGFQPGVYDVYVYSWVLEDPTNSFTDITVVGGSKGTQACGGIAFQTNLVDGGNYVFDQVLVTGGGTIQVIAAQNQGCARVNAFQILGGTACGAPVSYCTPGTSASGCQAVMSSTGTPSATASAGFDVQASGVEGQKDGLFFYGVNGQQANFWGNGTSYQCVVPPVFRGGLLPATGTAGACDGFFVQDLNALWSSNPAKNPGVGADVNVQLWYRDPLNTSNQTTSLSDGLNFTVCP